MLTFSNRASDDLLASFDFNYNLKGSIESLAVYGNKPNAIVRPLQHNNKIKSIENNDGLDITDLESQIIASDNKSSEEHDTKTHNGFVELNKNHLFSRQLDQKLRSIHLSKDSSRNGSTRDDLHKKPLFITTVPRGVFLQPTKILPPLPKKMYTFSSKPKILMNRRINLTSLESSQSTLEEGRVEEIKHEKRNYNGSYSKKTNNYNKKRYFKKKAEEVNVLASGVRGFKIAIKSRDEGGQSISLQQNQQQHLQATQTQSNYQNVMHDRRIVRGTNFNNLNSWNPNFGNAGLLSGKAEGDSSQKEYEKQRRIMLRNKQLGRNQRNIIGTPPPCKGRKHENVQTEKYLEELFDRPPEFDVCCQTDLFLQRPPTPKHVPGIAGVDASTEILDGELFDFHTEVQPIIETLVGRTLEQALIEVMHEEELADLKEQQQKLLAIREKEEAEVRRLEEQEMRLKSEKKRRLAQDMLTKELDSEMQQRVTAAKLIQGYISDLLPGVLEDIEPLRETADRQLLEEQLKPWLAQEVAEEIGQMIDSRDLLEEIVKQVLKHRAELYTNLHRNRNESVAIEDLNDTAEINDADPDQTN